jgi:hypothetical protein
LISTVERPVQHAVDAERGMLEADQAQGGG